MVETEHPSLGVVQQVASPVRFGDEPTEHHRAPLRNEHFDVIVRALLGYDEDRVAGLTAEGAFGEPAPGAPTPVASADVRTAASAQL